VTLDDQRPSAEPGQHSVDRTNEPVDSPAELVLKLSGVQAGYGRSIVLQDVDFAVRPGTVVAVLGANGAGKTTLMRVIAGLINPTQGRVEFNGDDITRTPPFRRAEQGICFIPQGRTIFRNLTVRENLILSIPPRTAKGAGFDPVIEAFPRLGQRLAQTAGSLSGGEQQMLAMSRAYLTNPKLIILDEPSSGLAPVLIDQIFESMHQLAGKGVSMVIVEQYVHKVLTLADTVNILVHGEISWNGPANTVDDELLRNTYLGAEVVS
jgi:branched-chain amino acid transport system ATP-binding protein